MPQKLQTNEAARAPQSQGDSAKTPADAQAKVQLMDFTSRRSPVMGTRGMVASSQPLASEVRNKCLQSATCYWCRQGIPKFVHNPCVSPSVTSLEAMLDLHTNHPPWTPIWLVCLLDRSATACFAALPVQQTGRVYGNHAHHFSRIHSP